MMHVLLADAAPTGAGLAIVGIILLAMVAVVVALAIFVVTRVVRRARKRRLPGNGNADP